MLRTTKLEAVDCLFLIKKIEKIEAKEAEIMWERRRVAACPPADLTAISRQVVASDVSIRLIPTLSQCFLLQRESESVELSYQHRPIEFKAWDYTDQIWGFAQLHIEQRQI